jgi:heme/copper-type cytochrome/quinol oxidase subunit 2
MNLIEFGRLLVLAGTILIVLGVIMLFSDKLALGRLPGDVQLMSGKFHLFIPITTCILVSIVLTVIVNFFFRR